MSEVRATTLSDLAGTGPTTLTGQEGAKMYLRLGGSQVISHSFNISSVSDNGAGDYGASFTNNLDNSAHPTLAVCDSSVVAVDRFAKAQNGSTATVVMSIFDISAAAGADAAISLATFGDLA